MTSDSLSLAGACKMPPSIAGLASHPAPVRYSMISWHPVELPIRTALPFLMERKYETASEISAASFWREEVPQPVYEEDRRSSARVQLAGRDWERGMV